MFGPNQYWAPHYLSFAELSVAPGCKLSVALKPTKQKLKECSKRKEENIVGSWILLLDFGRDEKRELPGVIQQRYLHGKISVLSWLRRGFGGYFCVTQHQETASTAAQEQNLLDITQGDGVNLRYD